MLIADSGSTKTDWCVILDNTPIKRIGTKGLNPFFQSEEEIQQELTHSLLPQLPEGNNRLCLLLRCRLYTRESSHPPAGNSRQFTCCRKYQSLLGYAGCRSWTMRS